MLRRRCQILSCTFHQEMAQGSSSMTAGCEGVGEPTAVGWLTRKWMVRTHSSVTSQCPGILGIIRPSEVQQCHISEEIIMRAQGSATVFWPDVTGFPAVVTNDDQILFRLYFVEQFRFQFLEGGWKFNRILCFLGQICLPFHLLAG